MAQNKKRQRRQPIGLWGMVKDVLIASMNRGLFPLALMAILFGLMIWKMTSEGVDKLVFRIYDDLMAGFLVGYILFGIVSLLWFIHARSQRKKLHNEIMRISKEKSKWQSGLLPGQIESSED